VFAGGSSHGKLDKAEGEVPFEGLILQFRGRREDDIIGEVMTKRTRSNGRGQFSFQLAPNIDATNYRLQILNLPQKFIPLVRLPLSLDSTSIGENFPQIEIPVAEAASLEGKVTKKSSSSESKKGSFLERKSLAGISIILKRKGGNETRAERTDEEGKFTFPRLRPGEWKLVMDEKTLPPDTRVEKKRNKLNLGYGCNKEISMAVSPKERKIKWLNQED